MPKKHMKSLHEGECLQEVPIKHLQEPSTKVPQKLSTWTEALVGCVETIDEMLYHIVEALLAEGNAYNCQKDEQFRWFPMRLWSSRVATACIEDTDIDKKVH